MREKRFYFSILKDTVQPRDGLENTFIEPLWFSTIALHFDRPRPTPSPCFPDIVKYSLKIRV